MDLFKLFDLQLMDSLSSCIVPYPPASTVSVTEGIVQASSLEEEGVEGVVVGMVDRSS